jgi:hypothetical protein
MVPTESLRIGTPDRRSRCPIPGADGACSTSRRSPRWIYSRRSAPAACEVELLSTHSGGRSGWLTTNGFIRPFEHDDPAEHIDCAPDPKSMAMLI